MIPPPVAGFGGKWLQNYSKFVPGVSVSEVKLLEIELFELCVHIP